MKDLQQYFQDEREAKLKDLEQELQADYGQKLSDLKSELDNLQDRYNKTVKSRQTILEKQRQFQKQQSNNFALSEIQQAALMSVWQENTKLFLDNKKNILEFVERSIKLVPEGKKGIVIYGPKACKEIQDMSKVSLLTTKEHRDFSDPGFVYQGDDMEIDARFEQFFLSLYEDNIDSFYLLAFGH